jgi:hypothetical protein
MKLACVINLDATGSMHSAIEQVKKSVDLTCYLARVLPDDIRLGLVVFRNYNSPEPEICEVYPLSDPVTIQGIARDIAVSGGFGAEAFRTGHLRSTELLDPVDADTTKRMIIAITDMPPMDEVSPSSCQIAESNALGSDFNSESLAARSRGYPVHFLLSGTGAKHELYDQIAGSSGGSIDYAYFNDATTRKLVQHLCSALEYECPERALQLQKRFRSDESYQRMVGEVLAAVIDIDVSALSSNAIFGVLWREVCHLRTSDTRDRLVEALSARVSRITDAAEKANMKEWIEHSYDSTAEIEEILSTASATQRFVLDGDPVERKVILELSRGCSHETMRVGLRLIAQVRLSQSSSSGLPIDLPNDQLFRLLAHLMYPGTLFGKRASVVLAFMCVRMGNALAERAAEFLENVRGTWFNTDIPEYFSFEFLDMVLAMPQYLLDTELAIIEAARNMISFGVGCKSHTQVVVGWRHPHSATFTYKDTTRSRCAACNQFRSASILVDGRCPLDEICGIPNDDAVNSTGAVCRVCDAVYEIVRPQQLKCPAKCHNCRAASTADAAWPLSFDPARVVLLPKVRCRECFNTFVGPLVDERCGECQAGKPVTFAYEEAVGALIDQHEHLGPHVFGALRLPKWFKKLAQPVSAYKQLKQVDFVLGEPHDPTASFAFPPRILNGDAVVAEIIKYCRREAVNFPRCGLCYENCAQVERCRQCAGKICGDCASGWYGSLKPGALFLPTRLLCPMCKQKPAGPMLARYNREAMAIRNVALDDQYYHGWCLGCYNVRPALDRVCGGGDLPELNEWSCEQCALLARERASGTDNIDERTRKCPSCAVPVEKTGGCDHITCVCGEHWCWQCQHLAEDGEDIYEHLWATHGGLGL